MAGRLKPSLFAMKAPDPMAFQRWQAWIKGRTEIDAGQIIGEGIPGANLKAGLQLSAAERAAEAAPAAAKIAYTAAGEDR